MSPSRTRRSPMRSGVTTGAAMRRELRRNGPVEWMSGCRDVGNLSRPPDLPTSRVSFPLRTRLAGEGDERAYQGGGGGADPLHPPEAVEGSEGTEAVPVGDDPMGERRPDTGQSLDGVFICGVEVDRPGRCGRGERALLPTLPATAALLAGRHGVERRAADIQP